MRIYLCGFMGTGKSVVGKNLAYRLGFPFLDMDEEIEKEEGISIPRIFKEKGETYFRDKEKEWVRKIITMNNVVVSLGGGTIVNEDNFRLLEDTGVLILLEASPEVIFNRTKSFSHRPLLEVENPKERIKELLNKRRFYYNRVSIKVDTDNLSVDEVTEKILKILDEYKRNSHTF